MAVLVANYVPVDAGGAWRGRIGASMAYYSRRPGKDLDRTERDAEGRVLGRFFYTADGEKIPLREAEERFAASVEARESAWREQRARERAERLAVRDAAFEERCRRFLQDPEGKLSPERREQLVERWRHTRAARERLPDPVFRAYRVVLSTSWAVLDGKDVEHVLGVALAGTVGAVAGSVAHAAAQSYRDAQRHARGLVRTLEREREAEQRREQAREQRRAERDAQKAAQAQERRQERADRRFAERFVYVHHRNTANPHVHAVVLTDRRLKVADLDAMRERLGERERVREQEQDRGRARQQERDGGRGLW